jgi:hypothetical protein
MDMSENIADLATALAKAQAEIEGAAKGKVNPAFRSKYADLASVWDAIRAPLTKNGLSVVQAPMVTPEGTTLRTMLLHASGQWMASTYPISPTKNDMQGIGSATTYARRYSLMAMVGVAPEDDDGNAATGKGDAPKPSAPPPSPRLVKPEPTPDRYPHRIDVPVLSDGDGSDWIAWGQRYAAAINGATDAGELEAWVRHNAVAMGAVSKANPKAHARLANLIDQRRIALAEMPAPVEGAADATILDAGD